MSVETFTALKKFLNITSLVIIMGLYPAVSPVVYGSSPGRNPGTKYFKNYSRQVYHLQSQNWSIIQDKRGVIYVGNQGGLLEFDGVSWREITFTNKITRSLALHDNGGNGTIFVGGANEIGYLSPDSKGTRRYVSLIPYLDEEYRNFSHVWRTHRTSEGIYFSTTKFLFLWNFEKIKVKVWKAKGSFAPAFLCGNKIYVRQHGLGLLEMNNGSLELIPGGDVFSYKKVYMMVEFEPGKLLVGTRSEGFYLYDDRKVIPFETAALNLVKDKYLSYGIRLSSGDFALATLRGGVFIVDSHCQLKHVIDKASGLPDNTVNYIYEDFQGNLWLALDNGITKIEYGSPISIYDDKYSSLSGQVLSVVRHGPNNNLYVGTTNGLYYLDTSGKFRVVPGIPRECWSLLSTGGTLLAATSAGLFQVEDNSKRLVTSTHSFVLQSSPSNPDRIWVGKLRGLAVLYLKKQNHQWEVKKHFDNINQEIRTIAEDRQGNLWLGTLTSGVIKIDFPAAGTIMEPVVTHYNTTHGLPDAQMGVFWAAGHVMFATNSGIFRFDEKNKRFIPDKTLTETFAGGEQARNAFRIREDKKKNIWVHSEARILQAIPGSDGTFVINEQPFLRLPITQVSVIYPDPYYNDEVIWFASVDGLIRYDTNEKKNYDLSFRTLIREVVVNGMPLMYDAEKFKYKESKDEYWKDNFPVFPYKDRNLRFHFAAPFFEAETQTRYQCFLEGYDDDWTAWSQETWKDYTNLDSGSYTFRVQAKNVYDTIGSEAVFQFKILPPWYKAWWAYLLYTAAAALMIFLVVKWRSWKLVREKQHLEQIILERTKEIKNKNLQLLEQSKKLEELDKIKSQFFANISHEFRTPLTLITGPLEQMLSSPPEDEGKQKKKMRLMLRNSRRLLSLINQLLDLSRFDSGKMKLQASQQNIVPFLKGIVESFDSLAVQNELHLEFHTEEENITLYFDGEKIEKAVCNLLINAIKFTPPGGKITVTLDAKKDIPPGFLEISVGDTGIGIPLAQLEHIFDRFYQAQGLREHAHKGSGIGLALTKELVRLHHGEISVHSREGIGSEFTIRLPLGDAHLEPEEIARQPGKPVKPEVTKEEPDLYMIEKEEEEANQIDYSTIDQSTDDDLEQEKNIILVVEDSADVRSYIRSAIEPDYQMIEAKDGREGIKKAQQTIPDLIISDVMMPGVDGYELCRVLKKDVNTSHIPVILLTARAAEDDIIAGLETGADDYITKPFNTRILCARIKNLIDLRRHWQQTWTREMTLQPTGMTVSEVDKKFIKELKAVMEKNIPDTEFNVDQLCRKLYMSHATLYRKIHALTGETPTDFIRSYRLKRGAELLKKGVGTVLEVALEVGFSSANYFTKCFKKKFHQLPTEYQAIESE